MTSSDCKAATDLSTVAAALVPDREALRELSRRRPTRVFLDVASCYAAIFLSFALLAWSKSTLVSATVFVLIGNRLYALSVLAHDGKHGNLLLRRKANDWFTRFVLAAPVGIVDFHGERARHRQHHEHLATEIDPDRALYRLQGKRTRGAFASFALGIRPLRQSLEDAMRPTVDSPGESTLVRLVRHRGEAVLAQVLIFAAIATFFSPSYYFVFWAAPIFVFAYLPHKLRMFCEHAQPTMSDDTPAAHRLVTYTPGRVERTLMSPMGMNYHGEHHLWAFVPYHQLPALHALVADSPVIETRRSYLGFAWRYFQSLPRDASSRRVPVPS